MKVPFHSNTVWPPPLLIWLFVVAYGLLAASLWLIELPFRGTGATIPDPEGIVKIRTAILGGAAGVYALFRLWRFHPICNQAYSAWLRSSPWTAGRPLPLGPVHPVWQDGVVIGVLTVIAVWHAHIDPIVPVEFFALSYLAGMTMLLAFARRWWSCLALGFLWPALILPGVEGMTAIPLIATIIVVIGHGHQQSLKVFPWDFMKNPTRPAGSLLQLELRIDGRSASGIQSNLGWPFGILSPKVQPAAISHLTSICLSTLFGWWSFCGMEHLKDCPPPELIVVFAGLAAVFRLARYCAGLMAPFSLWSRIAWGRIVVPGFDKIFLTPLVAVLVSILGGMVIKRSGVRVPVTESCVFALVWYVLFAGGPTLRNWVLTGQHRFRPPAHLNANRQLLKSV